MTQCPMSECGPVERCENTKQPKGPVSLERAPMEPAVLILEQGNRIAYDPDTAVRGDVGDVEVIYLFTQDVENELPKEI